MQAEKFVVRTSDVVERKCVPLLVSYWSNIAVDKDTSAVRHDVAVERRYDCSAVTTKDIINRMMASKRSLKHHHGKRRMYGNCEEKYFEFPR